jgi:hypothetical protein
LAEQTFNQAFEGYWRESNKNGLPAESGIYCVYECTFNFNEKNVTIHKLIYIGESADVRQRVEKHEKLKNWQKHVRLGNQLCYSFSPVDSDYRNRVAAAFIYHHKPPENSEYVNDFPFDKTIIKTSGKPALIEGFFVVDTKK